MMNNLDTYEMIEEYISQFTGPQKNSLESILNGIPLQEMKNGVPVEKFTAQQVKDYFKNINSLRNSVRKHIAEVRNFVLWKYKKGYITSEDIEHFMDIKPKVILNSIDTSCSILFKSFDEFDYAISTIWGIPKIITESYNVGIRYACALYLIWQGIDQSDICQLLESDLNLDRMTLCNTPIKHKRILDVLTATVNQKFVLVKSPQPLIQDGKLFKQISGVDPPSTRFCNNVIAKTKAAASGANIPSDLKEKIKNTSIARIRKSAFYEDMYYAIDQNASIEEVIQAFIDNGAFNSDQTSTARISAKEFISWRSYYWNKENDS